MVNRIVYRISKCFQKESFYGFDVMLRDLFAMLCYGLCCKDKHSVKVLVFLQMFSTLYPWKMTDLVQLLLLRIRSFQKKSQGQTKLDYKNYPSNSWTLLMFISNGQMPESKCWSLYKCCLFNRLHTDPTDQMVHSTFKDVPSSHWWIGGG